MQLLRFDLIVKTEHGFDKLTGGREAALALQHDRGYGEQPRLRAPTPQWAPVLRQLEVPEPIHSDLALLTSAIFHCAKLPAQTTNDFTSEPPTHQTVPYGALSPTGVGERTP